MRLTRWASSATAFADEDISPDAGGYLSHAAVHFRGESLHLLAGREELRRNCEHGRGRLAGLDAVPAQELHAVTYPRAVGRCPAWPSARSR